MNGAVRLGLAVGGVLGLAALASWSWTGGGVQGPARVEAAAEFRVSTADAGLARWTLLDGRVPGGPVVVADGALQADRGDPMQLELLDGRRAGDAIQSGQPVARLRAPRLEEELEALAQEARALEAEEALRRAGGRPETIARAQQSVRVAEATLARAQSALAHVEGLASQGAAGGRLVAEAREEVAVRQAELALARAAHAEARQPALPEELEALQARRAAVQARLGAAQGRMDELVLRAPVGGTLLLPGGETLVQVVEDGVRLLQVAVPETARGRVRVGDRVEFAPTSDAEHPVPGRVVEVGASAVMLGMRPVVWVVAELEGAPPIGATGLARLSPGAGE
ncbi:hypothetical protein L6R53_25010 [Myxococcota bacterium]|nr:hypothetical protein [Myxococcota bacterium]